MYKIGFACKWLHHDRTLKPKQLREHEEPLNQKATTVRWLNEHKGDAEEKLYQLMRWNIQSIHDLIKQVGQMDPHLRMCRLSSPILPVATEDTWKYFWSKPDVQAYCEKHFAEVGDTARQLGVKVSFHPGQFTVLASDSEDIVNRSIEEFEYHTNMARWMGFGKTWQDGCKINVHISGRQGPEGIRKVLPRLSPEARNLITIENDEVSWGLDASLELERDVALVLDIHHHWVNSGEYIQANDDRVKRVIDSWRGIRPTLHYSVSREDVLIDHNPNELPDMEKLLSQGYKKMKLRAHSDFYWIKPANEWAATYLDEFDIMCESKAKNLASVEFYKALGLANA
jgi:UV DNA damage endonuclease